MPNHFTQIFFCCKTRDLLCSHSNGDLFSCEDNMLFSRVKAHQVFNLCLYNKCLYARVRSRQLPF